VTRGAGKFKPGAVVDNTFFFVDAQDGKLKQGKRCARGRLCVRVCVCVCVCVCVRACARALPAPPGRHA
jgi:hypothetical protein